ncbi:MAG TPA: alpha/beta hydrolase [Thermoanaerobaculia bacterium]|nr:alpha/beta hydrolase [Thermoanaerobaculia bacterium]
MPLLLLLLLVPLAVGLVLIAAWCLALWAFARVYLEGPDLSAFDSPPGRRVGELGPPSAEHQRVVGAVREMSRAIASRPLHRRVAAIREALEDLLAFRAVDAEIRPTSCDGVPAEWVIADDCDPDRRMLYLHGGGFVAGSPRSHRPLCADLARGSGAAVLSLDYRLIPEHRRLAAVEDCRTAYRWLLEHGPQGAAPPRTLLVAGDSAGGNLALVITAWARDCGLRLPDAVVAFSPATDGTFASPTFRTNLRSDPMLGPAFRPAARFRTIALIGSWLWLRMRPAHPTLSPVFGDLAGLPPTLVQASEAEVLLGDARRWVNRARAAGSPAELESWPHMVHVFQALGDDLPEAAEAQRRVFEFLDRWAPRAGRDAAGAI